MGVKITKSSKAKEIDKALLKIALVRKRKSIKDFYGALQLGEDGLDFQKKAREEWE